MVCPNDARSCSFPLCMLSAIGNAATHYSLIEELQTYTIGTAIEQVTAVVQTRKQLWNRFRSKLTDAQKERYAVRVALWAHMNGRHESLGILTQNRHEGSLLTQNPDFC